MDNNNSFKYTYSAAQQDEVKKIREKYIPREKPEEDKLEQLRRLDEGVIRKANIISLVTGIISTLIMGIGMSCCMVWGGFWFIPGIIIGVIGIAGVSLAYPVYTNIVKKEREKIAPEIIRLTDELMK